MEPTIDLTKHIKADKCEVNKSKYGLIGFTIILILVVATISLIFYVYFFLFKAPNNPKNSTIVHISSGESISEISSSLLNLNIISSKDIFKIIIILTDSSKKLQQGDYLFENGEDVYQVVMRLANGNYGIEEESILIREGLTRKEIVSQVKQKLPLFSEDEFMNMSEKYEGYLFPDTYKFFKTSSTTLVFDDLRKNFNTKTSLLRKESDSLGFEWSDIIKVASLVELEGKTKEDREMIADIIYRRIKSNMPLQLDAPFLYFMNKASLQLTSEDLYSVSPYNTYRNGGLPPTPICNPGLESISAAIYPKANDYLYYLSDRDGIIHFSKTFEEHKAAKKLYLTK